MAEPLNSKLSCKFGTRAACAMFGILGVCGTSGGTERPPEARWTSQALFNNAVFPAVLLL
jgi:hypothetical protein